MKRSVRINVVALTIVLAIFTTIFLVSCSSYAPDGSNEGFAPGDKVESDGGIVVGSVGRKIVYNVYLNMSSDSPSDLISEIKKNVAAQGGYLQQSDETTYEGYAVYRYVVRIPTEKLDAFVSAVESKGSVGKKEVSTVDITQKYVDAESTRQSLILEKTRLEELFSSATVSDAIIIGQRLSEINAEITSVEKLLNEYDSLIDFSTVTIEITHDLPKSTDERSFSQKLNDIFKGSFRSVGTVFRGIAIGIVAAFPYILIISLIVGTALFIAFGIKNVKKTGRFFPQSKKKSRKNQSAASTEDKDKTEGSDEADGSVADSEETDEDK